MAPNKVSQRKPIVSHNLDDITTEDLDALIAGDTLSGNQREYAKKKAIARKARKEGDIRKALSYEALCEQIYERMTTDERW